MNNIITYKSIQPSIKEKQNTFKSFLGWYKSTRTKFQYLFNRNEFCPIFGHIFKFESYIF